ncbi:hypothetical protein FOTG_17605 [Fusarium oxysporum f. sp. vasinfectum 25433]|uniref:Phosphatidylserine decarboxylase n=1 Tax=Fusarium oxysporum f. sp. vasinfectum 25433 TaxID=1089449 RepID=X0KJZ0_FUSOX|nr:phosphatidylserine decarboxylase [Fusarium oxysporum f. sp. vasinfectum 25433]EXM13960.1 hypothetical protein FOTG_17605 [Fusarium oxysporum f. sp. vasinfectum 25433]
MNKALNQSMRAILPLWKTTPTATLHRESGILPVTQVLEARRLRFSARLKSLDEPSSCESNATTQSAPLTTISSNEDIKYR